MAEDRVEYVRIVNGLDFEFLDRWDGIPVRIPPGGQTKITPEMAFHFFGYHPGATREMMLRHTAKRHGWNTAEFVQPDPQTKKNKAEMYFDRLKITPVVYKLVPAEPDDPQTPVPADTEVDERPRTPKRVEVTL